MKRVILVLGLLFLPLSALGNSTGGKHYCAATQIELTDSAIFIHLSGGIFELDSLFSDQGGIYYTEEMLRCTQCRKGPVNPKDICQCSVS